MGRSSNSIWSSVQVTRMGPLGLSRSAPSASTSAAICSNRGAMASMSFSPASVGATLRVVRASRRTPSRSSRVRMVWLSADAVMPSLAAALVKLRSRATARKACRSLTLVWLIAEFFS